jgi:hypothetical protein
MNSSLLASACPAPLDVRPPHAGRRHYAGCRRRAEKLCRHALRRLVSVGLLVGAMSGTVACHDLSGLAGAQQLPAGIPDPSVYHTAAGAMALYQETLAAFQSSQGIQVASTGGGTTQTSAGTFVTFVLYSGLLTDELQAGDLGCTGVCSPSSVDLADARQLPDGVSDGGDLGPYSFLQQIRNDAILGIGALAAYDSAASPALRGHLYALAGYADLFLADLYCSGVPLSTIVFNGTTSFTYAAGSSTQQVYAAALAQFDTAIALSSDSARILDLARVGKGRAWLALAQYDSAAAAVASVPDAFAYQFVVDWTGGQGGVGGNLFIGNTQDTLGVQYDSRTVADRKGFTGLPFISSGDPRSASQIATTNRYGVSQYVPVKYGGATPGLFPITVADGVEARLIRAEAALHAGAGDIPTYLTDLTTARTLVAPSLPTLTDPGTDTGRVTLLFHERALDLFLTGHRQGDLRRLMRQYGRSVGQVYPTGPYPLLQIGTYGSYVEAPVPDDNLDEGPNPLFHGCLSRGA